MSDCTENSSSAAAEDPQQAQFIEKLSNQIKDAKHLKESFYKKIKAHRNYAAGRIGEDGKGGLVRANLIYTTIATVRPRVYAKNPEIVVSPTEAVDPSEYPAIKQLCKTLQVVLDRLFVRKAKLKKRAKAAVGSTMTTSIAWGKLTYQREFQKDPIIQGRMNDIQENIARIRSLIADCEDEQGRGDHEAEQEELKHQMEALQQQVEIAVGEGLALDILPTEDVVLDPDIKSPDNYVDAKWIAFGYWYQEDSYKDMFGHEADKEASVFASDASDNPDGKKSSDDDKKKNKYRVWEVWHKQSNTVYTICEGAKKYAREPYHPNNVGEQWYPSFPLVFNPLDGSFEALSDVELLKELQDEYNATRTQFAEHRALTKPHYITDVGTSEAEIRQKEVAGIGEIILVDANGRPLKEVFQAAEQLPIDPALYDNSHIRDEFEMISGAGDAASGNVRRAKTLGEAEIMENALSSRTNERQDIIEDWIVDMAQYAAEILLQVLTPQQVQRIAGRKASWPELRKEEIFDLVQIEIRAGSTGKPNKAREQEQWVKFLPEIQKLIQAVAELRSTGQGEMAEALIKVAEETLRRFDERIEVEEFLPQPQEGGEQQEAQPPSPQDQAQEAMAMREMQRVDEEGQLNVEKLRNELRIIQAKAVLEETKVRNEQQAQLSSQQPVERSWIEIEQESAAERELQRADEAGQISIEKDREELRITRAKADAEEVKAAKEAGTYLEPSRENETLIIERDESGLAIRVGTRNIIRDPETGLMQAIQ